MQKAYHQIDWENYPSEKTPVNERNLNKIDVALNEVDNRVLTIDLTKMDKTSASGMLTGFKLDTETGVITLTYYDGSNKTINTNLAKIALNISYDAENERLVLNMPDGTITYVDMSALITVYEFMNSDTIYFTVTEDGKVKADIKDGSVTENKLQPNFLADIRAESSKAETSAAAAATSESNAKTYMEKSQEIYRDFQTAGNVTGVKGDKEEKYRTGQINITAENVGAVAVGGDISDNTVTFDEAAERTNIVPGEKQKTFMGKIKKWLADLTAAAFAQIIGSYSDLMANTVSGYLPDATAVKEGLAKRLPLTGGELTGNLVAPKYYSSNAVAPSGTAYQSVPFISEAPYAANNALRAGYGFHNQGCNAAMLYLDNNGDLKIVLNNGTVRKIITSNDITSSGSTLYINTQ